MLIDLRDSPKFTKEIFTKIIQVFEDKSITQSPLNYYVWYNFFKNKKPEFCSEMDLAINNTQGYSDRLGRRLYENFLCDDNVDEQFDQSLKRLITNLIDKMDTWNDKVSDQTDDLSSVSENLSQDNIGQEELKNLTNMLVSTANSMKEASSEFHSEMLSSQNEITQLKKDLIEAKSEMMTDELTQVGNRKSFNNAIIELSEEAKEAPASLSLIMADIDFFKRFNDNFGHLVGDSVLRYFSNVIKKNKQPTESIFRYGGEEFGILIANSNVKSVMKRAEQIRTDIEGSNLKLKDSTKKIGTITSSFGVSTYKGESDTIDEFIDRADKALYLAKEKGRNQVRNELEVAS